MWTVFCTNIILHPLLYNHDFPLISASFLKHVIFQELGYTPRTMAILVPIIQETLKALRLVREMLSR